MQVCNCVNILDNGHTAQMELFLLVLRPTRTRPNECERKRSNGGERTLLPAINYSFQHQHDIIFLYGCHKPDSFTPWVYRVAQEFFLIKKWSSFAE